MQKTTFYVAYTKRGEPFESRTSYGSRLIRRRRAKNKVARMSRRRNRRLG